jgi:acyl CoA:acetate/3-ketoacid CoA transferase alpha subunit
MKESRQMSAADAARMIREGDVIMVGGFGMTGHPVHVMHALAELGTRGLSHLLPVCQCIAKSKINCLLVHTWKSVKSKIFCQKNLY